MSFSGVYYSAGKGLQWRLPKRDHVCLQDLRPVSDIEKLDEYSFSLTPAELNSEYNVREEWLENGVKNIAIDLGDHILSALLNCPLLPSLSKSLSFLKSLAISKMVCNDLNFC